MATAGGVMSMTQTWAKPCPETDSRFDAVHEWMTKKANRRRSKVIQGDWLTVVETISREQACSTREVSDAMASLLDLGWIEKTDDGFRVLVGKIPQELSVAPAARRREETSYARSAWVGDEAASEASDPKRAKRASGASESYAPKPHNPKSRVVVLARETFPRLCLDAGMEVSPLQFKWDRLAAGITRWQKDYGVELGFVRQMMIEFAKLQPRSRKHAPEVLFLARREQLTGLVLAQRQRDPGGRRFAQNREWWPQ